MKLIILPILLMTYFYSVLVFEITDQYNTLHSLPERQQNQMMGRSPAIAYQQHKKIKR